MTSIRTLARGESYIPVAASQRSSVLALSSSRLTGVNLLFPWGQWRPIVGRA